MAVTAVQHERYRAFAQAMAKLLGIAVAKTKVQHGCRQATLLDDVARLSKCACRHDDGAGLFESCHDVEGDKGLVLKDEDRATSEAGVHGTALRRGQAHRQGYRSVT
jgi:hypothetical protein